MKNKTGNGNIHQQLPEGKCFVSEMVVDFWNLNWGVQRAWWSWPKTKRRAKDNRPKTIELQF